MSNLIFTKEEIIEFLKFKFSDLSSLNSNWNTLNTSIGNFLTEINEGTETTRKNFYFWKDFNITLQKYKYKDEDNINNEFERIYSKFYGDGKITLLDNTPITLYSKKKNNSGKTISFFMNIESSPGNISRAIIYDSGELQKFSNLLNDQGEKGKTFRNFLKALSSETINY